MRRPARLRTLTGSPALAFLASLWLAGALSLPGCGEPSRPPVDRLVLVTIDTLRADRVGAYGDARAHTPNLDALATAGVRFATAISPALLTLPSHASIMTGLDPPAHAVRDNSLFSLSPAIPTLAEHLRAAGYATGAFVAAFVLDSRFGLARGFDRYDDDVDQRAAAGALSFAERPGDAVVDAALGWLQSAPERFFLWVHLYDPHADYSPPPRFARLVPGDPYAGEIAFADAQVGRLLAGIRRRFGIDSLAVLVTSDHGESLGEHDEETHTLTIYDATQHVPMLLYAPGLPVGGVVREPVRSIDVAPTLLDLAGAAALPDVRGRSLLDLARGRRDAPRVAYIEAIEPQLAFGWSPLIGIRTAEYKYIRAPRPELYDLANDPGELRNLAAQEPERAAESEARLAALELETRPTTPPPAGAASGLDAAERARLERLGYLVPAPREPGERALGEVGGPDPKDHMVDAAAVQRARQLVSRGLGERALAVLAGVPSRGDPIERLRAEAALLAGRFDRLAEVGRRLVEQHPEQTGGHYMLGLAELGLGEVDAAEASFERVRGLEPDGAAGYLGLASVARARGDRKVERALVGQAVARENPPGAARLQRALIELSDGHLAEARKTLASLSPVFLDQPETQVRIARAEHSAGEDDAALARLARALEAHPDSRTLGSTRAALLEASGRLSEAVVARRALLALDPEDPGARNDLAWGLATAGESLDEALRLAESAAAGLANSPSSLDTLATVHLARDEPARALAAADRGLVGAAAGLRPHLLYVRAAALAALGRSVEARASLTALSAEPARLEPPWSARAEALAARLSGA